MTGEPENTVRPPATGRASWQAELDRLLDREKAHTREGDAIAAARWRLPMVEVDAAIPVTGEHGPVPLLEVFEGRTFFNGLVSELSHLHSRDVTFATFCQGPYQESIAYFMGWRMPWYSARDSAGA